MNFQPASRRAALAAAAGVAALIAGAAHAEAPAASEKSNQVDAVVVTASPIAGDPDRFATIVEQVRRDDVLASGGANLADALRDVPGVSGSGFAAGASRPIIRGMDAERVKVTENGLSSSDVSDVGPDHGVPIDPLAAQDIEVVRGAATLRYGSQAIGGVVNAINNRIPMRPVDGVHGEGEAAYESVAHTGEGSAMLDAGAGPIAVHVDGFGRRSGNYDTPLGEQPNSFFHGGGYSAGASYFFGPDSSRVGGDFTHYQARYGIPSDSTYINMKQDKGAGAASLKFDGLLQKIDVDASYANYTHSEIDPDSNDVLSTFNNKEWDGRAEATLGQIGIFSGAAAGVQLQDRKFDALGEGADYLLPTHTASGAGFLFLEAPLGPLQMQAAGRIEHLDIKGTPAGAVTAVSRDYTPVSVSIGVTYDLNGSIKLGLTGASAARAPAQTELFARGPHDGPGTFETGNPELKMERANSLEATFRSKLPGGGKLEGSLWGARFDNYIYGDLTGRMCDDDGACAADGTGDLKELNYGQRDATFWGAELKGDLPVGKLAGGDVSANVLADYVRAKLSGAGNVPRIQPGRIGGGLTWSADKVDASFLVLRVAQQDKTGAFDTPTDGYTSLDAQIAWRPFSNPGRLEVMLVGHNLTDATIRNATSLNKDDVVMPGRDIRVVLRTKF
jgi:iron complex outermembrane receptor protein